jgi:hypothetical protein
LEERITGPGGVTMKVEARDVPEWRCPGWVATPRVSVAVGPSKHRDRHRDPGVAGAGAGIRAHGAQPSAATVRTATRSRRMGPQGLELAKLPLGIKFISTPGDRSVSGWHLGRTG